MPQDSSNIDIFGMLSSKGEEKHTKDKPEKSERQKRREEMLACTKMKDLFADGKLTINKHTCVGVQCKLCIKQCPTNALYWKSGEGEVGITEDLCVYCGACVLTCMVDNCMKVKRKREEGAMEEFSKSADVLTLAQRLNARKRVTRVKDLFPSWESYCERYKPEE